MSYDIYKRSGYLALNLYKKYYKTNLTADQIAEIAFKSNPSFFVGQLGYRYEVGLERNTDKLESAMKTLAMGTSSGIPTAQSFYDAIKAEMDSSFTYIAKYVYSETSKDVGQIASDYGKLGELLATAVRWSPLIILLGVSFYVYKKGKENL